MVWNLKTIFLMVGILVFLIIGIIITNKTSVPEEMYQTPLPVEVVRQYFESWNQKDYPNMYATLSDGFKSIDPNAQDLATFKQFASSQGIEGVNILLLEELSNDGVAASVKYSIIFTLSDGREQPFSDTFTLKSRPADVIMGWKLIHPYGENIDTT